MDSRISALNTRNVFLLLTQKSRGDANRKDLKIFRQQSYCLLDKFKPYQRRMDSIDRGRPAESVEMGLKLGRERQTARAFPVPTTPST